MFIEAKAVDRENWKRLLRNIASRSDYLDST